MRTPSKATSPNAAAGRRLLYRTFSALLNYPGQDQQGLDLEGAMTAAHALGGLGRLAHSFESLRGLAREGRDLEAEYVAVFGHSVAKECPPYETLWGPSHVFMQTQELADIAGFYRAWGVDVSDSARERADHISVELEFMSLLAAKEAHAAEKGLLEPLKLCRRAQVKFMGEHLGRWVPSFTGLLEKSAGPAGFYAVLARTLREFVAWDSARMGVAAKPGRTPRPVADEPQAGCSGCEATRPGGST